MKTENTNCLTGFECPKCGSLEPFYIECKVVVQVFDNGTEDIGGQIEWEDDAYCRCGDCDTVGEVKEFKVGA